MNKSADLVVLAILSFSLSAGIAQGDDKEGRQNPRESADAKGSPSSVFQTPRDHLSAAQLIGTPVRGANGRNIGEVHDLIVSRYGNIVYVVAKVGGTLGIGEQRVAVPWVDARVDRDMRWVQTPLVEGDDGKVSTFGFVSREEDVAIAGLTWNAGDLIGDYVSLHDPMRYALVADVLFSRDGNTRSVVVRRVGSPIGPGWDYAYPYAGYKPARYADPLLVAKDNVPLYDHVQLDELSRLPRPPEKLATTPRLK